MNFKIASALLSVKKEVKCEDHGINTPLKAFSWINFHPGGRHFRSSTLTRNPENPIGVLASSKNGLTAPCPTRSALVAWSSASCWSHSIAIDNETCLQDGRQDN